ncbi:MAG: deoxyguanosinetriphosphate triphosphohydrolase [Hyphomicrobiaceae bacterium]
MMDATTPDAMPIVAPAGSGARVQAPFAVDWRQSAGRKFAEPACPMRTPFQRDRDRIVHATAFRRLNYKTQVFLFHEGDHYRSRLTHSLEVAQIARAIARQLGLDEDLTEALALAHDLGHPPFGHAGERALDRALAPYGGFDHNAQSLKVVTQLERKYAAFDGLNLTFETLEGLIKHNGPVLDAGHGGAAAHRVLLRVIEQAGLSQDLYLPLQAPLEAQVAAIADDIAWANHDIDDGLRAGLIRLEDLLPVPLVGPLVAEAQAQAARIANAQGPSAGSEPRRLVYEVNRRLITAMIRDCVAEIRSRLALLRPENAAAIRRHPRPIAAFAAPEAQALAGLKAFLFARVYRHARVVRVMDAAETVLADLFARYSCDPATLSDERRQSLAGLDDIERGRRIGDFIAGMTDRFAIAEHKRLFAVTPDLG